MESNKTSNLYTFEIDENVNEIKQLNLLHGWICGTIEWDMNEKLDNTTEFVTLLNKWDCWRIWECKRDKTIDFVALLNMWDFELN